MHDFQQQFHKSYRQWSPQDKQQAEEFFISNKFFSPFYQNKKLQEIARICLYRKLQPGQKLMLENNNRAEAIILLTGDVIIRKKERKLRKKQRITKDNTQQKGDKIKRQKNQQFQQQFQYTFLAHIKDFNQTLTLNSECSVQVPQNNKAQIIFVPCGLYYQLQDNIEKERVQKIQQVLEKYFFRLKKKELHQLSQSNCIFRQFKMNNYIYRASSKPQEIYILLQGMVKLQKSGFSQQTLNQNVLINAGMIFGQKDLKLQERTRNAVVCTARVQVLTIPKISFLKYAEKAFPDLTFQQQKLSPTKLPKLDENLRISHSMKVSPNKNSFLPLIKRQNHFHQSSLHIETKKSQSQQKRQYELIRNSHMLLDIKEKKNKKFELRKFSPKSNEEVQILFKNQKSKLKRLKIQSRFSLDNSLLNL